MYFDVQSHYYSGQGVCMLGSRTSAGKPFNLIPVGNVSDLKISVATTVVEHQESQTGQRGIDLRLQTQTKASLSMTMESFNARNLSQALRGSYTTQAGASASGEALLLSPGAVTGLAHMKVSSVVITQNAVALTAYVNDSTAWDYKVNTEHGSILMNDGSVTAQDKFGLVPSAITVGATTVLTVPNTTGLKVGDTVYFRGFTGADAADLNGLSFPVTAVTATTFTIALDTTSDTITLTSAKVVWAGMAATAAYTYQSQILVDSLTTGINDIYMRFEGLNTAESNNPVVIEVFRFSTDPLKELAMISDTVQQFVLEGSVLLDSLQATGSKYFNVRLLA